MDRITRRLNDNIIEFVDGKGYGNLDHIQGVRLLFERLAAYEDTLLSPEEIQSLISTIESQKEEIEKWREFGKVTIQWYKDNEHPLTAVNAQAKLDWISYTPTLCEIERQAIHWQEGDSK